MRVLIDTNVIISYLLSNVHKKGAIHEIMVGLVSGEFTLLLPETLLEEIVQTVQLKPRLSSRISPKDLQEFVTVLQEFGETIPRIDQPIPEMTRDPKDDYLLAYAFVGVADYLVTGDKDLLVLKDIITDISIVTPRQFSDILNTNQE